MSKKGQQIFANRYLLDAQVSSSLSTPVWRAMDTSLKRWVTLVLLPATDPRGTKILESAQAAATNSRRDVIAILDVIPMAAISNADESEQSEPYLAIITEWLDGETLDQRLIRTGEVFTVEDALALTSMMANTLVHSHSLGIFHQRLRPHNVVFSEDREVRLSGFGLDSSLLGTDPSEPSSADIAAVGNILFAMVTGVWPNTGPKGGLKVNVDALASAPAGVTVPSQLTGGVRETVDTIYRRTQNGSFQTMRDLADALTVGLVENSDNFQSRVGRITATAVSWHGAPESKETRIKSTLIALVSVIIFGWIGWQLLTSNFHKSSDPIAILASPLPSAVATESNQPMAPIQIMGASDFDPFGDNTENPGKTALAIDGDKATAWTTVNYKNSDMGKSGVGLLLDLGSPRPITTVSIDFSVAGQLADVYLTDSATPDLATAEKLGSTTSTGGTDVVKAPRAISGRYVLVWIKPNLPKNSAGTYQGGIAEIKVGL